MEERVMKYRAVQGSQEGAALFVSLVILLLMTIIALTATRMSNLEFIMGTNTQNAAESFMRAENSALEGEQRILLNFFGAPTIDFSANPDDGLYLDGEITVDTVNWAAFNYETAGADPDLREYIIEYLGPAPLSGGSLALGVGAASGTRYLYQVSGRGTSSRRSTRVVQTIFATIE